MICPVYQFVKVFTQGLFVGMQYTDKLHFASHQDAILWLRGVNKNNECGCCDYRVINFEYIEDKVLGGAVV
jgi:hypothetical protein